MEKISLAGGVTGIMRTEKMSWVEDKDKREKEQKGEVKEKPR